MRLMNIVEMRKNETVEKPFNSLILSKAKDLSEHDYETLHCVQGESVDFVPKRDYFSDARPVRGKILHSAYP